jgi:hypothetical protein
LQRVEDRSTANTEAINGGPNVPWEQSIRGRLHLLITERNARVMRERDGLRRFSRGEALALLAFGLIQTGLMLATFLRVAGHG